MFKYQKQSLDLISKSIGLPTLDEMLEHPNPDLETDAMLDEFDRMLETLAAHGFDEKCLSTLSINEVAEIYQDISGQLDFHPLDNGF
jgi:hypothetical protein